MRRIQQKETKITKGGGAVAKSSQLLPRSKPRLVRTKHLIHPNYAAWRQLRLQMSKQEVRELLGPPRVECVHHWEYGFLRFPSQLFRIPYCFLLYFDPDRLVIVEHPFGSTTPREGKPSVPVIYYPQPESFYSHYPRYFDIRWSPSAGTYPISYELHFQHEFDQRFLGSYIVKDVAYPHFVGTHPGAQRGRVRVRAVNSLGKSRWSEFSTFAFTV